MVGFDGRGDAIQPKCFYDSAQGNLRLRLSALSKSLRAYHGICAIGGDGLDCKQAALTCVLITSSNK